MGTSGADDTVTLHSTWRGLILSGLGSGAVFAMGLWATLSSGGAMISVIVLGIGSFLFATVLFDYPVASTFTADRVERRALLRRHRIPLDRVDQLTRTRPGLMAGWRSLTPGGMAAKIGKRRYLLVDQCESLEEFRTLSKLLAAREEALGLDMMVVPKEGTDPTWTYRRGRWSPPGSAG